VNGVPLLAVMIIPSCHPPATRFINPESVFGTAPRTPPESLQRRRYCRMRRRISSCDSPY
jgi:hypothetical protein